MKYVFHLLNLTIFILCISCGIIHQQREPLTKYEEWVIIDKTNYGGPSYRVAIQRNDAIKKVLTYEYYYERYNLGDTIKFKK